MNFQNTKNDLKVVISLGDESGIGPEIILKALCSSEYQKILTLYWLDQKEIYKIHTKILDP